MQRLGRSITRMHRLPRLLATSPSRFAGLPPGSAAPALRTLEPPAPSCPLGVSTVRTEVRPTRRTLRSASERAACRHQLRPGVKTPRTLPVRSPHGRVEKQSRESEGASQRPQDCRGGRPLTLPAFEDRNYVRRRVQFFFLFRRARRFRFGESGRAAFRRAPEKTMPAPYRPNMAALLVFGLWVAAAGFPCVLCSAETVGFEAAFQGERNFFGADPAVQAVATAPTRGRRATCTYT